jgi:hypothetical protein
MPNGFEETADNLLADTADEQHFFALMTSANNSGANGVAFLSLVVHPLNQ